MTIVEPEDGRSYGMAAVSNWVDENDFPLTHDDLRVFEDERIMLRHDRTVKFSDVLDRVDENQFEDIVDLWQAIGKALREIEPDRTQK